MLWGGVQVVKQYLAAGPLNEIELAGRVKTETARVAYPAILAEWSLQYTVSSETEDAK